jgi:hypothetical protein
MTNPAKRTQRRRRKDCLLTVGERLAIEPFKERYQSEVLKKRRVTLFKREIMKAYFNYLDSQNQAPCTPDELEVKTKVRPLFIIIQLNLLCIPSSWSIGLRITGVQKADLRSPV